MAPKKKTEAPEIHNEENLQTIIDTPETELLQPPAPPSQPASKKRPYVAKLKALVEEGKFSKKEITETLQKEFPDCSKGGIQTVVSDLTNSKYSIFKERLVVKRQDGTIVFQDLTPAD